MQAVKNAAASVRLLFTFPRPACSCRPPAGSVVHNSSRSPVMSTVGSRNLRMGGTIGVMGTFPGIFSFGLVAPPVLAPQRLLGCQQTRSMRHGQRRGKLGRSSTHRWALLRNMVTDLITHERIQTTLAKAKELKRLADKMITMGKDSTEMARRRASAVLRTDESLRKLFTVLAPRYSERTGGYTRVLRSINNRKGDNAPQAWIEYVDREGELRASKPPVIRLPYAKRLFYAKENADERLVEYYTKVQQEVIQATAERAARIQAHKIKIRPSWPKASPTFMAESTPEAKLAESS